MLSRSSKPNTSTISSPESISHLQKYFDDLQSQPVSSFPSIEEQESEEGKEDSASPEQKNLEGKNGANLVDLMPNKDFGEIFNRFFVAGHKKLLLLQSDILSERDFEESLLALSDNNTEDIQALREHCYQLQMVLFRSPKGHTYDTSH